MAQALVSLFPEIDFDKVKMWAHGIFFIFLLLLVINTYFKTFKASQNRRQFFEEFASENKFDPLINTNWYSVPLENIMRKQV